MVAIELLSKDSLAVLPGDSCCLHKCVPLRHVACEAILEVYPPLAWLFRACRLLKHCTIFPKCIITLINLSKTWDLRQAIFLTPYLISISGFILCSHGFTGWPVSGIPERH